MATYASMVIGAGDAAVNSTSLTSVVSTNSVHVPGSVKTPHAGCPFSAAIDVVRNRASTKYAAVTGPVLVIWIGTRTGGPLADTCTLSPSGRSGAEICAESKPMRAVNGSEVWFPDEL